MKRIIALSLILTLIFAFVGCKNEDTTVKPENASDTIAYRVDVAELDPNIYPSDYPLINIDDFEMAFENLKEANTKGELASYQDIVNIFGLDGAYYENCDNDYNGTMYKYYGWYADNGVSILVTFEADGDQLKYYAYTTNGII